MIHLHVGLLKGTLGNVGTELEVLEADLTQHGFIQKGNCSKPKMTPGTPNIKHKEAFFTRSYFLLLFSLSPSASIQKRLKKEKKAKRKLQEALEFESKRRERVEDALKHSSSSSPSPEPLHAANNNTKNGTTGCLLLCFLSVLRPFCLTSYSPLCFL